MDDSDAETRIRDFFDANYRSLLAEGGAHVLTPRALDQARQQVEHYWKRMRDVAANVTETEIRLVLPNQRTPKGRRFVIEGVVDLVREAGRVRMYDLKTHYCKEVESRKDTYAAQLNVYAHIWRELRGQDLHEMGIIAVQLPEALRRELKETHPDAARIRAIMENWDPLVLFPYDPASINAIIDEIAGTVDDIEDRNFGPPPVDRLRAEIGTDFGSDGRPVKYATLHCRNCDGRYSCSSYRDYALTSGAEGRSTRSLILRRYASDAFRADEDLDDWLDGNIALDEETLLPEGDRGDSARRRKPGKKKGRRRS